MGDFFDKLGKEIEKTVKVVGDKSSEWLELGRLNMDISSKKGDIQRLYQKLGMEAFSTWREDKTKHFGEEAVFLEIEEKLEQLGELTKKADDIRTGDVNPKPKDKKKPVDDV